MKSPQPVIVQSLQDLIRAWTGQQWKLIGICFLGAARFSPWVRILLKLMLSTLHLPKISAKLDGASVRIQAADRDQRIIRINVNITDSLRRHPGHFI
jgi:hypothetical protein